MREEVKQFIVAEVSKNWQAGAPAAPTVGQLFEELIEVNRARGYRLYSWQLHRLMTGARQMNETIMAVFERV